MILSTSLKDSFSFQERTIYSTSCSRSWLAVQSDCLYLIHHICDGKVNIGNQRSVFTHESCHLRSDHMTAMAIWRITLLTPSLNRLKKTVQENEHVASMGLPRVSPKNRSRRKVCLSRKNGDAWVMLLRLGFIE